MNQEYKDKIEKTVEDVMSLVNTFDTRQVSEIFINKVSRDHRSLQQSFTQLCLRWIEHCASDEYRTDLRNEDSKEVAKTLVEEYQSKKGKDFLPSDYLRCV